MLNDEIKNKVLQDIIFLKCAGLRPIVVHGGGPEITAQMVKAGKKTQFVGGLRVTDEESVGITEMALEALRKWHWLAKLIPTLLAV